MKYIDADKLRAEIERRKIVYRNTDDLKDAIRYDEITDLLSFLDTLQEPMKGLDVTDFCQPIHPDIAKVLPDVINELTWGEQEPEVDLEEAAMNYIASIENEDGLKVINFSGRDIKDAFIAGAEWQKEKMAGLSIHDLELLHTFLYAVKNNKHGAFTFTRLSDEQYEEVLRRFNKAKEDEK